MHSLLLSTQTQTVSSLLLSTQTQTVSSLLLSTQTQTQTFFFFFLAQISNAAPLPVFIESNKKKAAPMAQPLKFTT